MEQEIAFQKFNICEEEPVDLFLNSKKLVTFMCTLQNLKELAVGHLYSRKIIKSLDDITSLAACKDMRKIYGTTLHGIDLESIELNAILSTACGSGLKFDEKFLSLPKIISEFQVSMKNVKELTLKMFQGAQMYKETGGMHCAAIASRNEILALCEDVGRHNAVDKVIGKGLFQGVDFRETMILTTGRISSDMVLKAANISCPFIASRSIPTTLALELANHFGITLLGRVASSKPTVYASKKRIAS